MEASYNSSDEHPSGLLSSLRRWIAIFGIRLLKESGVSLASEVSMRKITDEMIGDNVEGEVAPFHSTCLLVGRRKSGGSSSACTRVAVGQPGVWPEAGRPDCLA